MTIFARDLDTGMAKWVYQMTPHDEWDYDGINEMILADQDMGGQKRKTLVHFDRNGFGYTLDRETGELLVAEKYDPAVNWATKVDMDKSSKTYGRPRSSRNIRTRAQRRGRQLPRASARRRLAPRTSSRRPRSPKTGCSTCRPTTSAWTTSRSSVSLHRGPALCRRDAVDVPARKGEQQHGQLHRLGRQDRQDRLVQSGAVLGLVRRARDRRRRRLLRHARGLSEGRRRARPARSSTSSRPRPASSATSSPTSTAASSMSPCSRASAAGPASALAAGLSKSNEGLGAVGGYAALANYTALGGALTVFALPN